MRATTNDNPKHINYWLLTPLLATHTHVHKHKGKEMVSIVGAGEGMIVVGNAYPKVRDVT